MNQEQYLAFVFEQLCTTLTEANGMPPTTQTVRSFLIGVFACTDPELAGFIEPVIESITRTEWHFSGIVDLAQLFEV